MGEARQLDVEVRVAPTVYKSDTTNSICAVCGATDDVCNVA